MQTRVLGNSELSLSVIGLGTWAIGGGDWKFGWGDQDDAEAIHTIRRAIDLGINWIDTAAVYGFGKSEELVGKALAEIPSNQRPIVATKCGRTNAGGGEIGKSLQRDSVIAECEASLKRLQVDCIDLYQMHWPEPDEQIEEGWQTLVELQQAGKVRHIGVSNHNVAQMKRLQAIQPIASLQPPYSMIARDVETEILPYCAEHNIQVVCYSPMWKGLLTGAFTKERAASLPESDHRSRDPKFQSPQLEINLQLVESLAPIAKQNGRTLAELAIAWTLRRPEVTSAIVGARAPHQIDGTIGALNWRLQPNEVNTIDQLLQQRQQALDALGPIDTGRV